VVLVAWMKSWGVGGGARRVDDERERGAGGGAGGVDEDLVGGKKCWGSE